MKKIYEIKSDRVKGIAFHLKFTWILTSLYTGDIILYDYIHKIIVDKYNNAHDGPSRCVAFHLSQPYFVSGGDDHIIKVWNYTIKKCLFSFKEHKDYVRSVQFHKNLPWILSSSDDMTFRIWNWLNRTLLYTVNGHDHYVMRAMFYPTVDWIISASLDSSIRIWDYTLLKQKSCIAQQKASSSEIFTSNDISLLYKLNGHQRGVNWVSVDPINDIIASCSDDKTIRLWQLSTISGWNEIKNWKDHSNNVSSVIFHPSLNYVISNSEDKTICLWDKATDKKINCMKGNGRFWALECHSSLNIFASGSDSGLIVFNYENMRLPATVIGKHALYFSNNLYLWDLCNNKCNSIDERKFVEKSINYSAISIVKNCFINDITKIINFCLIFNETNLKEKSIDSNSNNTKVYHYLMKYDVIKDKYNSETKLISNCSSACFISKEKCIALERNQIIAFNCMNSQATITPINTGKLVKEQFDSIYQASIGRFFLKFKNGIVSLFDVNTTKIIAETTELTKMKFVLWNSTMSYCALVGYNTLFIVNKNMNILSKIKEDSEIKTVCFDENNVLYYSTYFHVKYALIEHELKGIVQSIESPFYIMAVLGGALYYSTISQQINKLPFDYIEIRFKLDLLNKNYDSIVTLMKSGKIEGLKSVENIHKVGFPELSLQYVQNDKEKFYLAMKSGMLDNAKELADKLKEIIYYEQLSKKAMTMGRLDIVEFCYIKSQSLDKLLFFYAISGRQDKLRKVNQVLHNNNDNSRLFLNSIYTNDFNERIRIMNDTGHESLALLNARLHHKEDDVKQLNERAMKEGKNILFNENDYDDIVKKMKPIIPLKPVVDINHKEYHSNWLCLTEIRTMTHTKKTVDRIFETKEEEEENNDDVFKSIIFNATAFDTNNTIVNNSKKINSTAWGIEDEGEDDEDIKKLIASTKDIDQSKATTLAQEDPDLLKRKASKSHIPGIQLSINNIKLSLSYLKSQLGIHDYTKLKEVIKDITMSNYTQITLLPYLSPIQFNLRHAKSKSLNCLIPFNGITLIKLNKMLSKGYDLISNFEMSEALNIFRLIIKYSLFFIATDSEEETQLTSIIGICREYIYLIKLSLLSDSLKEKDKIKYCTLVCLMSLCKLELKEHTFLILKKAKYCCKNIKNFITALHFVKRLTMLEKEEYDIFKKDFDKNKEELDLFQKIGTNQHIIDYDTNDYMTEKISQLYSSINLSKIKLNEAVFNCPLCFSICQKENNKGMICGICDLCLLGESVIGLKVLSDIK